MATDSLRIIRIFFHTTDNPIFQVNLRMAHLISFIAILNIV